MRVSLSFLHHTHATATELFKNAVVRDCLTDERIGAGHCDAILGFSSKQINQPEQKAIQLKENRDAVIPSMTRIRWRSITSRDEPLVLSSHRSKSAIGCKCSGGSRRKH